jgi:hypothetical protein
MIRGLKSVNPPAPPERIASAPATPNRWQQQMGLGDAVKVMAKPVVQLIRAVGGPDLAGCSGCGRRQKTLNTVLPNINPFIRR